jgi:hypothetical protein
MVLGDGTEVSMGNTYEQVESGRGQRSKETDRCSLCSHHPLDPEVDGLGVLGTEQSAGIDGAVEGLTI